MSLTHVTEFGLGLCAGIAPTEAAYRRAQRGTCPVRYRAAWAALVEAERAVVALLTARHDS